MKLATYKTSAAATPVMGAVLTTAQGERLLDLHAAAAALLDGVATENARNALGEDLVQFVRNGEVALSAGRMVLTLASQVTTSSQDKVRRLLSDPEKVIFLAPLRRPGKIISVGANYPSHVQEISDQNKDASIASIGKNLASGEYPPAFIKVASTLVGHGHGIPYPKFTTQLDYESELGFVIGRECQDVREEDALGCIAGYIICNDLSARDMQFKEMKRGIMVLGKNFDGSAPMGPYYVTRDEVPDWKNIEIKCWVNGELRQSEQCGRMIWSIPQILAFWSQLPLQAGDIFTTGSPAGVAIGMPDPEKYLLRPGDVIEIEMTGLGRLRNTIIARD
jgi:acylpyruvate hydrolase